MSALLRIVRVPADGQRNSISTDTTWLRAVRCGLVDPFELRHSSSTMPRRRPQGGDLRVSHHPAHCGVTFSPTIQNPKVERNPSWSARRSGLWRSALRAEGRVRIQLEEKQAVKSNSRGSRDCIGTCSPTCTASGLPGLPEVAHRQAVYHHERV